jgi:anti-sigma B factor antagonist
VDRPGGVSGQSVTELITVQTKTTETYGLVAVVGEIDIASAPALQEAIDSLVDGGVRHLIVDLDGVGFIDSSGLSALVGVVNRLGAESLGVVTSRPQIRRVFQISGLEQIIRLFDTVGAAISAASKTTPVD